MRDTLNGILRGLMVVVVGGVPGSVLLNWLINSSWAFDWIWYAVLVAGVSFSLIVAVLIQWLEDRDGPTRDQTAGPDRKVTITIIAGTVALIAAHSVRVLLIPSMSPNFASAIAAVALVVAAIAQVWPKSKWSN
jgi:hypothetical protein